MHNVQLASVLAQQATRASGSAFDLRDLFQGERLIDTMFVGVLLLVGLVAAGIAWRRSVDD